MSAISKYDAQFHCRMTNHDMLLWLVKTRSRDFTTIEWCAAAEGQGQVIEMLHVSRSIRNCVRYSFDILSGPQYRTVVNSRRGDVYNLAADYHSVAR